MKSFYCYCLSLLVLQKCLPQLAAGQRSRSRRFIPIIVFPPTAPTRIQFIGGIGVPLEDLNFEALTTGYVLKAEYALPTTAEQLRTKTTLPLTVYVTPKTESGRVSKRPLFENFLVQQQELVPSTANWLQKHKAVLTNYRWSVYKALEGLANRIGIAGRECVLKSICEVAEEPFHYANGIFSELLHILLTPSSSVDELSEHADNEYFHAESIGRSGASCERVFKECPRSLLTRFSRLHDLAHEIPNFLL